MLFACFYYFILFLFASVFFGAFCASFFVSFFCFLPPPFGDWNVVAHLTGIYFPPLSYCIEPNVFHHPPKLLLIHRSAILIKTCVTEGKWAFSRWFQPKSSLPADPTLPHHTTQALCPHRLPGARGLRQEHDHGGGPDGRRHSRGGGHRRPHAPDPGASAVGAPGRGQASSVSGGQRLQNGDGSIELTGSEMYYASCQLCLSGCHMLNPPFTLSGPTLGESRRYCLGRIKKKVRPEVRKILRVQFCQNFTKCRPKFCLTRSKM